ncbi:MAG: ThiF family adenylyltransferase [Planctomycetota bacterium]
MNVPTDRHPRHHRQTLLSDVGVEGQATFRASHVAVVGLGALGGTIAEQLCRAGVGTLALIDRDLVEETNLQRQVLFATADVGEPKAHAAADRLAAIDPAAVLHAHAVDLHAGNVESLVAGADVICDGTDNAETRYLLNDVAVKHWLPMVYGGCVGTEGRALCMPRSHEADDGPCLRCVFPEPPGPGELPTCDTAGVLGPAAAVTAAWQAGMTLQLLLGRATPTLFRFDLWTGHARCTDAAELRRDDCVCCGQRRFEFLERDPSDTVGLCGRNTMQVRPATARVDLDQLAVRWANLGDVERTPRLLRLDADGKRVALFPDGRMLVTPARDEADARSVYAKLVGT